MKKLPTDYQILKTIYNLYIDDYLAFSDSNPNRRTQNYLPLDLTRIASILGMEENLLFGRLNYDLENRYGKEIEESVFQHFFTPRLGNEKHCVHFPYLAGVLASMKWESRKFWLATSMSVLALFISIISLLKS